MKNLHDIPKEVVLATVPRVNDRLDWSNLTTFNDFNVIMTNTADTLNTFREFFNTTTTNGQTITFTTIDV